MMHRLVQVQQGHILLLFVDLAGTLLRGITHERADLKIINVVKVNCIKFTLTVLPFIGTAATGLVNKTIHSQLQSCTVRHLIISDNGKGKT